MFFSNNEKQKYLEILNNIGLSVDSRSCWWARYPKRACEEIYLMKENTNAEFSQEGSKLIWAEDITNNFETHFLISIEAKDYPYKMPKVFLKEPHVEASNDKHMFTKDGSICYMHPNSYNSKTSILQIRNQVVAWCFCIEVYANGGKWPAAEHKH